MSDEMAHVEEPEWPTHCDLCGAELRSAEVAVMPGGDEQLDTVVAQDFCPNPDCPGKAATEPGSLGGDNGGG